MDGERYKKADVEDGAGIFTVGGTVFLQRGAEDVFGSEPRGSGWALNPQGGYHIAGYRRTPQSPVEWVDVW